MAKQSDLSKMLAELRSERDVIDLAIRKVESKIASKPTKPSHPRDLPISA